LHVAPASYEGCGALDLAELDCSSIDVEGDSSGVQHVFVLVTGVDRLDGASFGIAYDPGVDLVDWQGCPNVATIAEANWPDSASGIAAVLDPASGAGSPPGRSRARCTRTGWSR
jgi:hypothetical protein